MQNIKDSQERYNIARARKMASVMRRKIKMNKVEEIHLPKGRFQPFVSIAHIKKMIGDPGIKIISFDIFDTLLIRPSLHPKDIFYLVAKKIDKKYNIDFIKLRWNAESKLDRRNATIEDIYKFIAREHNIDDYTINQIMNEEIRCEKELLYVRKDTFELYEAAKMLNKRIIAVSDMYLGKNIISDILEKNFLEFDSLYISCEYCARKDDGSLYDIVIKEENVNPYEILHIGDNWDSDYSRALEKKILSIHLPSVRERILGGGRSCDALLGEVIKGDPIWSLFLGFSLNKLYGTHVEEPVNIFKLDSISQFSTLILAPILSAFSINLLCDEDIQVNYKHIYFASRDGYLPCNIYKIISEKIKGIPGTYFFAGRRAYFSLLTEDFFKYINTITNIKNKDAYTLFDLLSAYFSGLPLMERLEAGLSAEEKQLLFFKEKEKCFAVLERFREDISNTLKFQRDLATTYYQRVFDGSEARMLIFDIGYSGSVGAAVSAAINKPTDKKYFWQTEENKSRDYILGTKTTTFFHDDIEIPYHLILEELFSPLEGGCIGWSDDAKPLLESININKEFRYDLDSVHSCCDQYAKDLCSLFGDYVHYLLIDNPDSIMKIFKIIFEDSPYLNLDIFRNIYFPDPVNTNQEVSLQKKIECEIFWKDPFSGTGFDNPENIIVPIATRDQSYKIGIHLHLYNILQFQEILQYLQNFPVKFDLYVTITDAEYMPTFRSLFNKYLIQNVEQIEIMTVPNKGRDVAPWLITLKKIQNFYDLFCHIHSKASVQSVYGNIWRKYLFDNLIDKTAVSNTLYLFENNKDLGCIFPAIFPEVKKTFIYLDNPVYGSEKEYNMICRILGRMGMREEVCRSEFFCSMGTMMWYRPEALKQLFSLDLNIDEFPDEPIGVGGTLAHALERVPPIVARRNGYLVKTLTTYSGEYANE